MLLRVEQTKKQLTLMNVPLTSNFPEDLRLTNRSVSRYIILAAGEKISIGPLAAGRNATRIQKVFQLEPPLQQ